MGCRSAAKEDIPTYPPLDAQQSLAAIRARAAGIESVSGEGNITLTDARGGAVRLDAAFVFAPPDRARVRAWKLGQAVLDLTVTPEGMWLFVPRGQQGRSEQLRSASGQTGQAVRQWLSLLSGDIAGAEEAARPEFVNGKIIFTQMPHGYPAVECEIDRATLTPRRYRSLSRDGKEQFALRLSQYQAVGPTVWPRRIEAKSAAGVVVIETRDPELNAAPEDAFKPPARAVKVP